MNLDRGDVLVCPHCKGELFIVVYRLALPRGSTEAYKQAQAYHCVVCKGTFPSGEVRPRREAGNVLIPR